ncbi:GNAT family N-acetyltransferase [Streptomyces sp. 4.24]|uniref:GNAT family N-acetyltransferase n=1 Tax=Streptomyces tritrimontium TaxID=3406573 RepID=UPI003BB5E3DA
MIETPRLLLRLFRPDDALALAAYRSDPAIARYQAWPSPLTAEEAAQTVRGYIEADPEQPGWFQYAIELKADRGLAGDLGVNLDENLLQAELGMTLAPALHGNGYAAEALDGILGHLFGKGLHHVTAGCDPRNTAPVRVLERAGFTFEGRSTEPVLVRGEQVDTLRYRLLAGDWKSASPTAATAG